MKKLRITMISVIAILLILQITNHLYVSYTEQKELDHQPYYELYSSYYHERDDYRMFLMVNPHRTGETAIDEILTETFIRDTITKFKSTGHGEYPIRVYMISPSEELPFGWKKSELNISSNFDQSVFYRNTFCTITIPFDAASVQECGIEWQA